MWLLSLVGGFWAGQGRLPMRNLADLLPRQRERSLPQRRSSSPGNGYGSECHLLRYLGRHRSRLDAAVRCTIPNSAAVEWLDFHFDPEANWMDGERKGFDFLEVDHPARTAWTWKWPQRGTPLTWDAVGRVLIGNVWEWLLVESKAHVDELNSWCKANEHGGRPRIREEFARVKASLGVSEDADWLDGYYQQCNRIAVLDHMTAHDTPAHMLWIYFTGDRGSSNRKCPHDELGWREALAAQSVHVGLPESHALAHRMHTLFLPVCPNA